MSLVATAKANDLDPKDYLTRLFQQLPNKPFLEKPEILL
ncbi:transposase domain-containing protein [Enterococcus sp. AZ194]